MRPAWSPEDASFAALAAIATLYALAWTLAFALPPHAPAEEALLAEAMPADLRGRLPLLGSRDGVSYTVRDVRVASVRHGLLTFDVDCTARVAGAAMSGHVLAAQGRGGVPRWIGPAPEGGLGAGAVPDLSGKAATAVGGAVLDYVATASGDGAGQASPSSSIANVR